MKQSGRSVPLLVAVSVTALVVGSVGTASAAGLTTTQVKRIVVKVLHNKESDLSVAEAKTAGSAKRLAGRPPAAYLDRVASSFDQSGIGGGVTVPAATKVELRAPVSLTLPQRVGLVHVTGGASFIAGAQREVELWYSVDGPCTSPGFGYDHRVVFTIGPAVSMGVLDVVQPLTPGTHDFRLCAEGGAIGDGNAGAGNSYITVETVAG